MDKSICVRAVSHLSNDPVMRKLIEKHGDLDWEWEVVDVFSNIVREIISQQLSGKAAATIFERFKSLLLQTPPFSPKRIISIPDDTIRHEAGISYAKIKYIKGLSHAILEEKLPIAAFPDLSDEEVFNELIKIKGIGAWTAEMILMFSLKRVDVFSLGDAGLANAISKLYKVDRRDTEKMRILSQTWRPYRTFAARYLWKSLDAKG